MQKVFDNILFILQVEEDDKLPKNICIQCCTKLQTVCEFIDTARKAQDQLMEKSLMLEDVLANKCLATPTKTETKSDLDNLADEEGKYTEMEVSVDPMMVLQNSDEMGDMLSPDNDDSLSTEDVTYLHGVDAENVTIKLIKKGDKPDKLLQHPDLCDEDTNESPKPFPCQTCKRGFYTELALKNHSWQHIVESNTNEKYTCSTCLESFLYKNDLIVHLKQHRTNGLCQLCGRM